MLTCFLLAAAFVMDFGPDGEGGYRSFTVDPQIPRGVTMVRGRVPTPCGFIEAVCLVDRDGKRKISVRNPPGLNYVRAEDLPSGK